MTDDDRGSRQAANLARHLNERYPDTVLFLARRAAGRPEATAAVLSSIDDDHLTLSLELPTEFTDVRVPLPTGEGLDARRRLAELLRVTRAGSPGEPLTSLEQQLAHGPGRGGPGRDPAPQ